MGPRALIGAAAGIALTSAIAGSCLNDGCEGDSDNRADVVQDDSGNGSNTTITNIDSGPVPTAPQAFQPITVGSANDGSFSGRSRTCREGVNAALNAATVAGNITSPQTTVLAGNLTDVCMDALSGRPFDEDDMPVGTITSVPVVCHDITDNIMEVIENNGIAHHNIGDTRTALTNTCAIDGGAILTTAPAPAQPTVNLAP
jgi:hypothetical protein